MCGVCSLKYVTQYGIDQLTDTEIRENITITLFFIIIYVYFLITKQICNNEMIENLTLTLSFIIIYVNVLITKQMCNTEMIENITLTLSFIIIYVNVLIMKQICNTEKMGHDSVLIFKMYKPCCACLLNSSIYAFIQKSRFCLIPTEL